MATGTMEVWTERVGRRLQATETMLQASLEQARADQSSSTGKGNDVEESLREWLRKHLPRVHDVGSGEVIDSAGASSRQCDVVVTTPFHPFRETSLFFVEGVAAAGEVKSVLTGAALSDALDKGRAFKRLESRPPEGSEAMCRNREDFDRFVRCPPFFLVAFESQLRYETIKERLRAFEQEQGLAVDGYLDGVFVLGKGVLINFGRGRGSARRRLRPWGRAGPCGRSRRGRRCGRPPR